MLERSDVILGFFYTDVGNNILLVSYVIDAIFVVDIFVSLRTAIVTPHGIVSYPSV